MYHLVPTIIRNTMSVILIISTKGGFDIDRYIARLENALACMRLCVLRCVGTIVA